MELTIEKRPVTDPEANLLSNAMSQFPNIGYIEKNRWNKLFPTIFVATKNKNLVGICATVPLQDWVKLGPFIILKHYQGKGFGKILLTHVVKQFPNKNLYIGSSNPIVWTIAEKYKFKKVESFQQIPNIIKLHLTIYFFKRLSIDFLFDALKKIMVKRKYRYFLKYAS